MVWYFHLQKDCNEVRSSNKAVDDFYNFLLQNDLREEARSILEILFAKISKVQNLAKKGKKKILNKGILKKNQIN